ncbi:MAG: hypothetical protein M0P31_07545 [Solirubrobacteraceae bacterium]|nr:hypothetical protein [Solirubrobacteraceae bacterium]
MDAAFAFAILVWFVMGVAGGLKGASKGSSFLLWFAISMSVPIFGFITAMVYPGRDDELRRRCDGCGRMLPISDTMCMRCHTDLPFPDVAYRPPS